MTSSELVCTRADVSGGMNHTGCDHHLASSPLQKGSETKPALQGITIPKSGEGRL